MEKENITECIDKDTISNISEIVENKMYILKKDKNFNQLDNQLLLNIDSFEKLIPKELKYRFDEIMRLIYQTEDYYFWLAYSLGIKYRKSINNI